MLLASNKAVMIPVQLCRERVGHLHRLGRDKQRIPRAAKRVRVRVVQRGECSSYTVMTTNHIGKATEDDVTRSPEGVVW